ncbi:hypothetical protein CFN78_17425 [Amycolatopsis antarctica]|uniref:Uncharacterized protein n=1 Tax=Amycolatopsis antarctica TaxID=1854586 RepID=A0A263D1E2_9PSEU|nr:hypothetical protein CFN78_17425 [Amycolatopsis antarctica]
MATERRTAGPVGEGWSPHAAYLLAHLDWLTAHPAASEFADELTALVAALPEAERRVELGPCARPGCGAPVHATVRADGSLRPQIACGAGHFWRGEPVGAGNGRNGKELTETRPGPARPERAA